MSKYEDDYDIDDEEDDEYDDYMDEDDEEEDDKPAPRSTVNPFSTGVSRPAAPSSANRFGDSSRLPGSPTPPRATGSGPGSPPPAAPRAPTPNAPASRPGAPPSNLPSSATGNRPSAPPSANPAATGSRPGAPPASPASSGSGFNRPGPPSAPPGRPASPSPFGSGSSAIPARTPADGGSGASPARPSPFGAKPADAGSDKPATPRNSPFGKPEDKKDEKGGGLFGGLASRLSGKDDGKKDDKPATPRYGGKPNEPPQANKPGAFSGLTSRFGGGNKDDKPASAAGGSGSRFGGDKPATPKNEGGKGGLFGGLRRGNDKPAEPARPSSGMPGSSGSHSSSSASSPFGNRIASPGSMPGGPARPGSAPKPPRPSLGERLRNFSIFKKPEPQSARARQPKTPTVQKPGVSLDTKLDILGVVLVLSSLALIFSSLSPNQGALTGTINTFLSQNLGWGAPAVPIAMFAAGIWLILRHFGEEAPMLDMVPVIGIVMIYMGLLVLFQYGDSFTYEIRAGAPPLDQLKNIFLPISYTLGRGGGWIGAEIYYFLVANLTEIGGFFVLLAWLIVGLMLALGLSAAEMAIIVISVWRSFNDARHRRIERRGAVLAEQQALSPALPGVTVSRPGAEQLPPGVRSPALPAPAGGLFGDGEERSIPITQGGRTVNAAFRPGDPIPVEKPIPANAGPFAGVAARLAPEPVGEPAEKPASRGGLFGGLPHRSAPDAANDEAREKHGGLGGRFGLPRRAEAEHDDADEDDNAEKSGGLGERFGGFARSVRTVLPGGGIKPAADLDLPADKRNTPAEAADAEVRPSGLGRFSNTFSRVREAMPGGKAADKSDDKPNEGLKPAATPPEASIQTASPGANAAPTVAAPERSSPFAPPRRPGDVDDEEDDDEIDDETDTDGPVSLGSLLGARPTPSVRQPARPFAPPTRVPAAETPAATESDDPEETTPPAASAPPSPTPVAPAASVARPEAPATPATPAVPPPVAGRPESRTLNAPPPRTGGRPGADAAPPARPSPFRSPVPPPVFKAGSDDEDEDEELDLLDGLDALDSDTPLDKLPPARPKGIGPLPRPAAPSPFNRDEPPTRTTPHTIPDPARAPTTSLQERLAALRNRPSWEPKPAGEAKEEQTTQAAPPAEPAHKPDDKPTERPTTEVPRIIARADDETEDTPARPVAPAASAADNKPAPPKTAPPVPVRQSTPPVAPAASYSMPERPTPPPPPARNASTAPSTPPIAGARGLNPPSAGTPGRRKVWSLPDYGELLVNGADQDMNHDQLIERAKIIEETLASFGAPGRVVEVRTGPVVTQFGVEPDYLPGRGGKKIRVKVSGIAQLDKDLQLALGARSIRIEAPVPGKGYVGIEVPNDRAAVVRLRDVLESPEFQKIKSPLGICLGQGVDGTPVAADLAAMPHLLIAGTTGSGKSVCVNTIIASLLVKNSPDRVKFIMVDPKRVELTGYNGIPHLVAPVVVELERIVGVLKWVTREMDERYKKFSNAGARNIEDFNKHLPQGEQQMPYIVVIIDELADLMMLAPDETERVITRIAALARATGIHLVIATQRPSVDVVTGLIKANFPARVAFAVASNTDSRVILDQPGAERLLGRGDMLYMSGDSPAPQRLQGVYVSDSEINNITQYWRQQLGPEDLLPKTLATGFLSDDSGSASSTSGWGNNRNGSSRVPTEQVAFWDHELRDGASSSDHDDDEGEDGEDAMYDEAVELVRRLNKASVSLLQRRLRIGYTRAARLIDLMEERNVIGPPVDGSKPREVLTARD